MSLSGRDNINSFCQGRSKITLLPLKLGFQLKSNNSITNKLLTIVLVECESFADTEKHKDMKFDALYIDKDMGMISPVLQLSPNSVEIRVV